VYFLRETRLGEGSGAVTDDLGRWALTPGGRLILRGYRDRPLVFSVDGPEGLRLALPWTDAEQGDADVTLSRSPACVVSDQEPSLVLWGMYSYLADAGIFRECVTDLKLPVATELDNAALERAYLDARDEPGQALLVELHGTLVLRPRMEGDGSVETLLVEEFGRVLPGAGCGGLSPAEVGGPKL
jgi:copper homeostasis protein (lipoprotein)